VLLADRQQQIVADRIAGLGFGGRWARLDAERLQILPRDRAPPPLVECVAYALAAERIACVPADRAHWVSPDGRWALAYADRVTAPTDTRH
jgi:hypothetical protein